MSKTKKSKLLASILCATVIAGLYAGPVMANDLTVNIDGELKADEDTGLIHEYHPVSGSFNIAGSDIASALNGQDLNIKNLTTEKIIVNGDEIDLVNLAKTNENIAGITRTGTGTPGAGITTIERETSFDASGMKTKNIEAQTANIGGVSINGGLVDGVDVSVLDGKVTTNETNINKVTGRVDQIEVAHIQLDGRVTTVEKNTAEIKRTGETTTIEGATSFDAKGIVTKNISADMVFAQDGQFDNSLQVGAGKKVVLTADGNIKADGALTLAGKTLTGDNVGRINGLFGSSIEDRPTIYAGDGSFVGGVQFNQGNVKADSITLAGINGENKDVATAINDLNDKYDGVDTDLGDLTGRVGTLETNTAGITNDKGVTVIDQGLKVKGEDGREVFTVARDGAINAVVTDGVGGTSANFALNGENVELKYGNNGIIANVDGTTISGNGTNVVVNENGATFTSANSTATVINGGAITADTLNLANLDEDVATEINNLKDSMDTVGGDVSDLRNDVAQNTNDIGMLRTDVGVLRTDVNTLRVDVDSLNKRLEVVEDKTQNINGDNTYGPGEQPSGGGDVHEDGNTDFTGNISSGSITTGEITADKGTIGGVTMEGGKVSAGEGNFSDKVIVGGENGTSITGDKITIGNTNPAEDAEDKSSTIIEKGDVTVTDKEGNQHSIQGNAEDIANIREDMGAMSNRISKVEDRIDKVGAMSAAIANLRTMGYDPTAPTEIAVGIGQYRSETGAALGLFHYPNKDFMLSLSVSTSGDEVMGGIGATWKFGRKSPEQMLAAEKEKAAKAKLAKAEAMKKAAAEAKVAAQQAKHAKMAAEKAAK